MRMLHRSGERTAAGSGKPLTEGHGGSVVPPFHPILIRKGSGSVHDENVEPTTLQGIPASSETNKSHRNTRRKVSRESKVGTLSSSHERLEVTIPAQGIGRVRRGHFVRRADRRQRWFVCMLIARIPRQPVQRRTNVTNVTRRIRTDPQ